MRIFQATDFCIILQKSVRFPLIGSNIQQNLVCYNLLTDRPCKPNGRRIISSTMLNRNIKVYFWPVFPQQRTVKGTIWQYIIRVSTSRLAFSGAGRFASKRRKHSCVLQCSHRLKRLSKALLLLRHLSDLRPMPRTIGQTSSHPSERQSMALPP